MYQLLDKFGKQVHLGSTIVYVVRHSTEVSLHPAYVYKISFKNDQYSLGVVALSQNWYRNPRVYLTILTADNFIVTDIDQDIKAQLMNHVP